MAKMGTTILVSSHIMDEAERCDTLGLILKGTLIEEGSVTEIRKRAGTLTLEQAVLKLVRDEAEDP